MASRKEKKQTKQKRSAVERQRFQKKAQQETRMRLSEWCSKQAIKLSARKQSLLQKIKTKYSMSMKNRSKTSQRNTEKDQSTALRQSWQTKNFVKKHGFEKAKTAGAEFDNNQNAAKQVSED